MATQRLIVATIAGEAAVAVAQQFERWRVAPDSRVIDQFCEALRVNGSSLPVVYFSEWVDRWSMGDVVPVPAPDAADGRRFQTACLLPDQAVTWADRCGEQFPEIRWSAARLREAATAWELVAKPRAIIVIREITGPSTTDDEVKAALDGVPEWLTPLVIPEPS